MSVLLAILFSVVAALLVDGIVIPRRQFMRDSAGIWLLLLMILTGFGLFLALCANPLLAALITLSLHLLLAVVSNAKQRMLGEPLHFSDFALVSGVFRHPQFYFSALAAWQKLAGVLALGALLIGFVMVYHLVPEMHLVGLCIAGVAAALLIMSLRSAPVAALARKPLAEEDVAKLGLLPVLLLYWLRWRESEDQPVPHAADPGHGDGGEEPEVIVVIQCESFADPVELFSEPSYALPGLNKARSEAIQAGNLLVSGFGAYTMRTEYGVLFGRSEEELGFRRYDPFLTAAKEVEYALSFKLALHKWRSLFVHPHDMRFYNRNRILPAAGFDELVSEDQFDPPEAGTGRYVSDRAVADKVLELARNVEGPTFIYAVTMENHGPWSAQDDHAGEGAVQSYDRLVRAGDAMLSQLDQGLKSLQKPALLVFFGDHRPSIPGASEPGGDRHTPYVMLRYDRQGGIVRGNNAREDLTPAQLHHLILRQTKTGSGLEAGQNTVA